jgi:Flp pilus assembly protein TadG
MWKFFRNTSGNAAVEFALALPLLVLILAGLSELGRSYFQAQALERGLRMGASYAARAELPLSGAARSATENLVKTSSMDGTLGMSASNWERPDAMLDITERQVSAGGINVTVIRLEARVPFDPLIPGLWDFMNIGNDYIELAHEQPYIGI